VNWNWDPRTWRTATKLLLGLVTIWPIIYIGVFVAFIFSGFLFGALLSQRSQQSGIQIDLIQLERKIQNGEIKELRITGCEIEAIDRNDRSFRACANNESTRDEIISRARELGADGRARVDKIAENSSQSPAAPAIFLGGFAILFVLHILTMLLIVALMPMYIILALKDDRHDQNMRIVWIVLIATVGILADVVYWYLFVWRRPRVAPDRLAN